jgi:toxin ParE1/3/4
VDSVLELVYRPAALDDLDAIFDFICADNLSRAMSFVEDIRGQCRRLCTHPQLGPARPDIGVDIRIFPMRSRVVIAYRVMSEAIEITRVFYGGQDYEALRLSEEGR